MFQHFGQRLKRDLKQIVDRRLEATAAASGTQVRVGSVSYGCLILPLTTGSLSLQASKLRSSLTSASGMPSGSVDRCLLLL